MTHWIERPFHARRLHTAVGLALALATAIAMAASADAQTLCSEPVEPICATTIPATDPSAATDQSVARTRCVEDAARYREKLLAFRGCLQGSVAEADRAIEATDSLIKCLKGAEPDCRLGGAR